jgi:hypothetical protein
LLILKVKNLGTRFGHCLAVKDGVEAEETIWLTRSLTMSIQKKSLLSGLNATKKAIVASSTTTSQASPTVSAPVSARIVPKVRPNAQARVAGGFKARVAGGFKARVAGRVIGRTKA